MRSKMLLHYLFPLIIVLLFLTACDAAQASDTYVWIDVPSDGISYPILQPVNVEGHASGVGGISRVEVYADGELWTTIEDPPISDNLARFEAEWLPPGFGTYLLQVIAYSPDGTASLYDQARITFGDEAAAAIITATPVITVTPVPGAEESEVQFWAEPETIQAGECTTIFWKVSGVAGVIFGGVEQPFEGSYQDCLCAAQTYTLTVNHQDGSEEKQKVNIAVTGTCADTTAPPAPALAVPANGLSISCISTQNLAWQPVNDSSGISEYRVQVQRHSGDNNWQEVPGSIFGGISNKQYNLSVECGWTYRWRVLAVDGAGNSGPWSSRWSFVIILE